MKKKTTRAYKKRVIKTTTPLKNTELVSRIGSKMGGHLNTLWKATSNVVSKAANVILVTVDSVI